MKISIAKLQAAVMSIEAETFSEQLQVAYIADLLREKDVVFHFFNDGEGSKGISIPLVGWSLTPHSSARTSTADQQ